MGLKELKIELNAMDKNNLIELVADMYKKYKPVKEHLDFLVSPNETELFDKYHQTIYEAFYPKRGDKLVLKKGKDAISEFKKKSSNKELLADLILFYAETGVAYTKDFGDINDAFYSSIIRAYEDALSLMTKEDILEKFRTRALKVVNDSNNVGWNFQDSLSEIYEEFYDEE